MSPQGESSDDGGPPGFSPARTALSSHFEFGGDDSDDDGDDVTVGTLATLRTTRTTRTAQTSKTTATRRSELDTLFEDLMGDGNDRKGQQQQAKMWETDTNDGGSSAQESSFGHSKALNDRSEHSAVSSIVSSVVSVGSSPPSVAVNRSGRLETIEDGFLFEERLSQSKDRSGSAVARGLGSVLDSLSRFGSGLAGLSKGYYDGLSKKVDGSGSTYRRQRDSSYRPGGTAYGAYRSPYASSSHRTANRRRGRQLHEYISEDGQSVSTNGVTSILDSMGLGDKSDSRSVRRGELDGFLESGGQIPAASFNRRRIRLGRSEREVRLRAGIVLFGLACCVFSVVRLGTVEKHFRGEGKRGMLVLDTIDAKAESKIGSDADAVPPPDGLDDSTVATNHGAEGVGGWPGGALGQAGALPTTVARGDYHNAALDLALTSMVMEHMPVGYQYLANVSAPRGQEIPLFWHIPRSGGRMVMDLMTQCHNVNYEYITAGDLESGKAKKALETKNGIVTPYFHDSIAALDSAHHALAFTLIRHPIERAASTYQSLHEQHDAISGMSLAEYAKSQYVENNWMVRYLSGQTEGIATEEHLDVAKEVLRKKFLVGMFEEKDESVRRFERYFKSSWDDLGEGLEDKCRDSVLDSRKPTSKLKEGGQAWNLLVWQNKLDMKLYAYAWELFASQGEELFSKPAEKEVTA
jgi:hypothetical protein